MFDLVLILFFLLASSLILTVNAAVSSLIYLALSKVLKFKRQDIRTALCVSVLYCGAALLFLVLLTCLFLVTAPGDMDAEQAASFLLTIFFIDSVAAALFAFYFVRRIYAEGWARTIQFFLVSIFMLFASWMFLSILFMTLLMAASILMSG
ncbi:MAG: hypothetical protein JW724_05535 [Candidatus Altiarchaeota archaeon]|nr:hypothetical protein [Candidatus Altiarchaeota archaeon]